MNFPLHWIISLHPRPHEPINLWQKVVVILSHSSFRKPHKSSIFWGFLFWAFSPMIFHTFSRGFISGLCGAHFIIAIPSSSRKLNSFRNIGVSTGPLCQWGRACWQRSSLETLALILPWKQTMGLLLLLKKNHLSPPLHSPLQISQFS